MSILLILEPFLFFSEQGYSSIRKIQTAVAIAKQHGMKVLFDEIRSGAFSTGSFLFTQKCMPVDVDFLCFSKGLALGVPTAVLAIKSGILSQNIIKKEDRLKSCMSTSEVAMQRANDLIDYYLSNTVSFNEQMAQTTERIINHFSPFSNYSFVENVNIMGLCCVFVFNRNIKKTRLKLIWTYMISKGIEVRHHEDNLWFLSFAIDSTDEELVRVKNALEEAMKLIK